MAPAGEEFSRLWGKQWRRRGRSETSPPSHPAALRQEHALGAVICAAGSERGRSPMCPKGDIVLASVGSVPPGCKEGFLAPVRRHPGGIKRWRSGAGGCGVQGAGVRTGADNPAEGPLNPREGETTAPLAPGSGKTPARTDPSVGCGAQAGPSGPAPTPKSGIASGLEGNP